MRAFAEALSWVAIGLLLCGYLYSVILAWRHERESFIRMAAAWVVDYPIFVCRHWRVARHSLWLVLVGLVLAAVSFWLLYETNPYRIR